MNFRLLKHDIHFQIKHGFYYIYAFVTVIYIGILLIIPAEYRDFWSAIVLLTDPSTLGFFFVGTIIMLERNQQIIEYLFITPIRLSMYLCSKILSLTVIAWVTSMCIAYFSLNHSISFVSLTMAICLASFFFTSCGLAISIHTHSLNSFLVRAILFMLIMFIPLLQYVNWVSFKLFEVFPSYSALWLIEASIGKSTSLYNASYVFHVCLLTMWGLLSFFVAYQQFSRYILLNTGGNRRISL
ncbi:fluoroquinolone export ABC transporter permease subunit [Alkalihalobacterium bogoriense]|uniref:fluoroquinolone export ABC transporter permease subunit n=1 Tax=Alkalihalobacterium bogoriense TaxID=246272 RepID=UPI00047ECC6A|nr:hypothetical protein [Alkalihalobacterium bogoriense]